MSLSRWQPARTAVFSMDCQNDICHERGKFTGPIAGQLRASTVLSRIAACLDAARAAGVLVVHVRHIREPGIDDAPDEDNRMFRGMRRSEALVSGTWGAAVMDEVAPVTGDLIVDKHRVSAFAGTELDRMLRQRGIDSLVLAGVTTTFVVEGTARDAVDRGYRTAVVSDGCVSLSDDAHRLSLEHVLPYLATVTDSDIVTDWLRANALAQRPPY